MNERGKVTEFVELRNDEFWDIQNQLYGGGWIYTNLRQVRLVNTESRAAAASRSWNNVKKKKQELICLPNSRTFYHLYYRPNQGVWQVPRTWIWMWHCHHELRSYQTRKPTPARPPLPKPVPSSLVSSGGWREGKEQVGYHLSPLSWRCPSPILSLTALVISGLLASFHSSDKQGLCKTAGVPANPQKS